MVKESAMGTFYIDCVVQNLSSPKRSATVSHLLVDTGSEYTWIPEADLQKAGIKIQKKDLQFVMAYGVTITREVGYALIRVEEFETVDEVVFAKPGDLKLLGSRTLEGFPAVVDARRKKLVAAGPLLAARSEANGV